MKKNFNSITLMIFLVGSLSAQNLKQSTEEPKDKTVENASLVFPNDYKTVRVTSTANPLRTFESMNLQDGLENAFKIKHQNDGTYNMAHW